MLILYLNFVKVVSFQKVSPIVQCIRLTVYICWSDLHKYIPSVEKKLTLTTFKCIQYRVCLTT